MSPEPARTRGVTQLGRGVVIEGDLVGDDDVIVYGRFEGGIQVEGALTIAAGASLVCPQGVRAGDVMLDGACEGDIESDGRVELTAESELIGHIRARRILIADGAQFSGSVDMHD